MCEKASFYIIKIVCKRISHRMGNYDLNILYTHTHITQMTIFLLLANNQGGIEWKKKKKKNKNKNNERKIVKRNEKL